MNSGVKKKEAKIIGKELIFTFYGRKSVSEIKMLYEEECALFK